MALISYAQNFEDVMLWRALRHVEHGFYIDVGAHDPRIDSVSRLFYEQGWRGLHVEPLVVYCDALRADRPDEAVLQAAVAAESGVMRFFEIPDTGISTGRADIAAEHRTRGFSAVEITVPCVTLKQVFDHAGDKDIHWLKVDVEGLEEEVLRSWGNSSARPWVVVVESTLPLTQTESYATWEHELNKRDYEFAYFDGLNRFYLASGKAELAQALRVGPNVFDGFSFSGLASAPFCHVVQEQARSEQESIRVNLAAQMHQLDESIGGLKTALAGAETLAREEASNHAGTQALFENERRQLHGRIEELVSESALARENFEQKMLAYDRSLRGARLMHRRLERTHHLALHNLVDRHSREGLATAELHRREVQELVEGERALVRDLAQETRHGMIRLVKTHQHSIDSWAERVNNVQRDLLAATSDLGAARYERDLLHLKTQALAADIEAATSRAAADKLAFERACVSLNEAHAACVQALENELQRVGTESEADKVEFERVFRSLNDAHADHVKTLEAELQQLRISYESRHQLQLNAYAELLIEGEAGKSSLAETQAAMEQMRIQLQHASNAVEVFKREHSQLRETLGEISASRAWISFQRFARFLGIAAPSAVTPDPVEHIHAPLEMPPSDRSQPLNNAPVITQELKTSIFPFESSVPMQDDTLAIPTKVSELTALSGVTFVTQAYRAILGRTPDPEGLSYYLNRLASGYSKSTIIFQLRESTEGRAYSANIEGLDREVKLENYIRTPLIGWITLGLTGREGNSFRDRQLRAIENKIHLFSIETNSRLEKIETEILRIPGIIAKKLSIEKNSETQLKNISANSIEINSSHSQDPSDFEKLSPRAREIYLKLKTTMVAHEEGII